MIILSFKFPFSLHTGLPHRHVPSTHWWRCVHISSAESAGELPFSKPSLKSGRGAQSPFLTSHLCYGGARQRGQAPKSPTENAASSKETIVPATMEEEGRMFTCWWLACSGSELGDLQSHQSVAPSCVQAVSNKLLNLIKSLAIILHSPEAPWSSAIMNTFHLIIIKGFTGKTSWKSSCESGWHLYKWTADGIIRSFGSLV